MCVKRAWLGATGDLAEERRMNDEALLKRVPLEGPAPGVAGPSGGATVDVRTIGDGPVDPGMGRMITSSPSKLRIESFEPSSVSGETGSVLTTTG